MSDYKRASYDTCWAVLIQKQPKPPKPVQTPIDTRTPSGKRLPY